mmetsp:Transcript_9274/g.19578  ORF Transcript_9274/g.19578 Transcript_9274/m.19578 type:complete len:401 (+) Transcript_9274:893-2095(+)
MDRSVKRIGGRGEECKRVKQHVFDNEMVLLGESARGCTVAALRVGGAKQEAVGSPQGARCCCAIKILPCCLLSSAVGLRTRTELIERINAAKRATEALCGSGSNDASSVLEPVPQKDNDAAIDRIKEVFEAHGEMQSLLRVHLVLKQGAQAEQDEILLVSRYSELRCVEQLVYRQGNNGFGEHVIAVIARDALRGLERLHKFGLAHGRVSPSNMIIQQDADAHADAGPTASIVLTDYAVSVIGSSEESGAHGVSQAQRVLKDVRDLSASIVCLANGRLAENVSSLDKSNGQWSITMLNWIDCCLANRQEVLVARGELREALSLSSSLAEHAWFKHLNHEQEAQARKELHKLASSQSTPSDSERVWVWSALERARRVNGTIPLTDLDKMESILLENADSFA